MYGYIYHFPRAKDIKMSADNYDLFDSQEYLSKLFHDITIFQDVTAFIKFFSQFPDNSVTMLDYAGGPNVFPLIIGAEKVKRYVHSDYAKNNRDEVERWRKMEPKAFDWKDNIRRCLKLEGKTGTDEEVLKREERMRSVLEAVVYCDVKSDKVIAEGYEGAYDVVTCSFCLECVFKSIESLSEAIGRISTLVKPGGYLITTTSSIVNDSAPYLFDEPPIAGFQYGSFLCAPAQSYVDVFKANGYEVTSQVVRPYHHPTLDIDDNVAITIGKKLV